MRTDPCHTLSGGLKSALQEGLQAARRNARPAAILVSLIIGLIMGYECWEPMRAAMNQLAEARERVGLIFAILSTAGFGGALPLVFRRLLLGQPTTTNELFFGVFFWGYKGVEMALFYDFQAYLWGTGSGLQTLAAKVLVDQTLYSPLISVPSITLSYLWLECGFNFNATRRALREKSFFARALPVLIGNTLLWLPSITIIYMFPTALQLPLQNLVLTFWVLILMIVAKKKPVQEHA